jgi:3-hydroxybutyryl-CoA dehydratase
MAVAPKLAATGLPEVGMTVRSRGRTVGEADVTMFSALSGDWHPQHSDVEWAAESQFGERIAHGMLVLSIASGLLVWDPGQVVALRAIREVVFKRPVRIGDTVSAEAEVVSVQPLDDQVGLVTMRLLVRNQSGATAVRARLELLWRVAIEIEGAPDAA